MPKINQFTVGRAVYPYSLGNCIRMDRTFAHHATINNSAKFNFGVEDFFYFGWVRSISTTGAIFTKGINFQLLYGQSNNYGTWPAPVCKIRPINYLSPNIVFDLFGSPDNGAQQGRFIPAVANAWHFYVIQRKGGSDAANRLIENYQFFWDGVLCTDKRVSGQATQFTTAVMDSASPFTLGYSPDIPVEGPYLNGYMNQMGSARGVWMTEAEVAAMFNGGQGAPPPERVWPYLQAYWFMNERNGRTLFDYANTYNPALTSFQHGQLVNYTDAQVAANGFPQSGQVAWCDHNTLSPITSTI